MPDTAPEDWCQRLKENQPDPLEEIKQLHESWLADLEGLALEALVSGDWGEVYAHINQVRSRHTDLSDCFQSQEECSEAIAFINRILSDEASTKSLSRSGADLLPKIEVNES